MTSPWLRLPLQFDIDQLNTDLARLSDVHWLPHINRQAHDGGWTALSLRSVHGSTDTITVADCRQTSFADTPLLSTCSYLPAVLASLHCPLYSARLMSLRAGASIKRHTDHDLAFEDGCARLHIPIQTHPDVIFHINDKPVHFGAGECWYMNANYPHQVTNNSPLERIHLVVDCGVNAWLADIFHSAGYQSEPQQHKYGDPAINDSNALQVAHQLEAMGNPTSSTLAARLRMLHQQTDLLASSTGKETPDTMNPGYLTDE